MCCGKNIRSVSDAHYNQIDVFPFGHFQNSRTWLTALNEMVRTIFHDWRPWNQFMKAVHRFRDREIPRLLRSAAPVASADMDHRQLCAVTLCERNRIVRRFRRTLGEVRGEQNLMK